MNFKPLLGSFATLAFCCAAAHAASVYDFDFGAEPRGTTTTFTDSNGTVSATLLPEGDFAFRGSDFKNVVSTPASDFAVDNILVASASAPEPGTISMPAPGLNLSGIGAAPRTRSSSR